MHKGQCGHLGGEIKRRCVFAHHDPEAVTPELMLKNLDVVDESDRQLLHRITEWMKEKRG
ncbi:MAG: hypothetical protein WCP20_08655 [Desulfuromonadales bacterium]